jgi:hypothetical protein
LAKAKGFRSGKTLMTTIAIQTNSSQSDNRQKDIEETFRKLGLLPHEDRQKILRQLETAESGTEKEPSYTVRIKTSTGDDDEYV